MKFIVSLVLTTIFIAQPVSAYGLARATSPSGLGDDPVAAPSPTPDQELERAQRETALAEEKQKKAEAEQAELEARRAKLKAATDPFGDTSKVTVPSGDVKTDGAGFVEVRMLSLEAARGISDRLANVLCKRSDVQTLIIYDQNELEAIVFSRTMVTQLQALSKEFKAKAKATDEVLAKTNPKKPEEEAKALTEGLMEMSLGTNFVAPFAATAIPGVAAGVISSIAQLANLFRTDTELKNKEVPIPEDMAVSYIVSGLNNPQNCNSRPTIYYPRLFPTNMFANNSLSPVLQAVNQLRTDKQTAVDNLKKVANRIKSINEIGDAIDERDNMDKQRTKLEHERQALLKIDPRCRTSKCRKLGIDIATLNGDINNANEGIKEATNDGEERFTTEHQAWLKALKKLTAETQPLVDAAEEIITKLDKPDATTNTTALSQLLQAEQLGQVLNNDSAFMLRVAVAANGTTKIKKNMFVDAKIRHTAGADLVYQLFDHNGRVVMGDAMQFYYEYKSASEVREEVAKGQKASSTTESTTTARVTKTEPGRTRKN